jgi:hypothetical protein
MSQLQEIKEALALMFESRIKAQRLLRERLSVGTEVHFHDADGNVKRGHIVKVQDDFTIRVRGGRPSRIFYLDVADIIEKEEL